MDRTPLFEVTAVAAAGDPRRVTTAANVRAAIGSPSGDDAIVETIIDRVSALMAMYCRLARDIGGTFPTLGRETCRATWSIGNYSGGGRSYSRGRPHPLRLPWRTPITITSVVENGVTLTGGTDYQLKAGGLLDRLCMDAIVPWSSAKIVVVYGAGFSLPVSAPPDLEAAAIDQVKSVYLSRKRDPYLRSEVLPDIWQGSYVFGSPMAGTVAGSTALMSSVEDALAPYRDWAAQ